MLIIVSQTKIAFAKLCLGNHMLSSVSLSPAVCLRPSLFCLAPIPPTVFNVIQKKIATISAFYIFGKTMTSFKTAPADS